MDFETLDQNITDRDTGSRRAPGIVRDTLLALAADDEVVVAVAKQGRDAEDRSAPWHVTWLTNARIVHVRATEARGPFDDDAKVTEAWTRRVRDVRHVDFEDVLHVGQGMVWFQPVVTFDDGTRLELLPVEPGYVGKETRSAVASFTAELLKRVQ